MGYMMSFIMAQFMHLNNYKNVIRHLKTEWMIFLNKLGGDILRYNFTFKRVIHKVC